ncbi:hypothetical protein H9P43_010143 [Blastocladiella emersonii ATCC 22665]|nr:hypothetical protein H9P43_010143 [Blastocladiella emersonii ATCC 22665]
MESLRLPGFIKSIDDLPVVPTRTPIPQPAAGQVLVRVRASGANFFDILLVQGKYQYKPKGAFVPGTEFAGVVEAVGAGVTSLAPGDRVFGAVQVGAYATHVVCPAAGLFKIPRALTFAQAAGISITYPTSYAALVLRANVQPGETVLVHAGAGGVGLAAIQIAKLLGALVIGTASSAEKLRVMRENGADHVINYAAEDWVARVREITDKRGVNVVFDPVGLIDMSLKVAAWNARLVVVGFARLAPGASEGIMTNRVLLKNVSVMGVFWGNYAVHEPRTVGVVWKQLLRWFDEEKLHPVVFPREFKGLASVKDALMCLGSRRESHGKVVVLQDDDGRAKL